jgi:hypothetical protein
MTSVCVVDNRDANEMYGYLEARIETLKKRIAELETENKRLRSELMPECAGREFEKSA